MACHVKLDCFHKAMNFYAFEGQVDWFIIVRQLQSLLVTLAIVGSRVLEIMITKSNFGGSNNYVMALG